METGAVCDKKMEHPSEERLPVTEEKGPEFYEKDKGSAGIHGQIFEYKFCALVFLKATNKGYKFKLSSNVKGLGAFDDVVVEHLDGNRSKKYIFVQLKSKMRQRITMKQLLAEKGDFSLSKYYDSYMKVEEYFSCGEEGVKMVGRTDESLFIIYTNADVTQEVKSKKVIQSGEEEFLMTGGSVLQFNEEEHKTIYEHLKKLPKHREFLSRLRIFYNQADEKEMDCHIRPELQQSMNFPDSELDLTYMCFIDFVKDWWQNRNYFLKDINSKERDLLEKTKEKVRTNLVAKILDQRKSELDDLSIKYKESAITDMEQMIEPHKAVMIFAPGRSTTLTAVKIHQTLSSRKHIILNLQQLVRYKTEVILAWKNKFDILVLESQSLIENFQGVFNEISTMLNECGGEKRFIFIANRMGNSKQISALRRTFSTKLREEYEDWKFADIITDSTTFLLEKKVTFQGTELQIKDLVKESDFRMLSALDCDSMSLLLANENPSIGTPTENTLEYYIDRTLERVTNFKSGIQTEGKTLDQFREENLEEIQGASAYRQEKCNVIGHGQGIPEFSLAKESKQGTRKQCSGKSTLLSLCTKDQKLLGTQNTDEFSNVQRGSQRNSSKVWRPSTLLDGVDRIILVTDDPGMGKSALLTHLAKQTRERHPDMWIVRVNINNYASILHCMKTNGFEENAVIKLLTEAAQIKEREGAQLEKQLFNYIYNSTGNMAVLIDGVDEVSPHYTEEVIKVLRILSQNKIRKIWVTSRNSVKDQLEEECECQSYRLVPFSVEDQKSFLVKFWNQKFTHIKEDYLEILAQRVVELSSKYLSVSETNFMEIPLQNMLLAEMFEDNLSQCSTSKTVELPEYINIVMLYDSYVKKKWDIYLSEKKLSDRTNVIVRTDDDVLYDIFIHNHKTAALIAILSTQHLEKLNDKNVLKQGVDFMQKIEQGVEKTGIITDIIEGRPVFLHRTFAEYFVARRLCDNISDSKTYMSDHLFESGFVVVRSMVDRILADKCPLHEAVLNSNMQHAVRLLKRKESVTIKDRGGRTPMHVAVSCRNPQLTRLLLEHGADIGSVDTLLGLSPVQYAIRIGNWDILSLLMEKRPEIREHVLNEMNSGCTEYIVSALRAAARYGHTNLLLYLLNRGNSVNMSLPGDGGTLLHEAARGNHIQTVRTLVCLGANCDNQDARGKTVLHVSAERGSLEVAKFIVERRKISYGEAALNYIVTLDRAIKKLNLVNVRDKDGNTPLHLAAAGGNTSTVRYLISAGSDMSRYNTRGEYPLTLAARYARDDTVKLLLVSCSAVKCEEIMTSALRAAIVAGQVDTTGLLLRLGAAVNGGENEKPIHIASRMGHKEIIILLLQCGARITSLTESGNTAFHLASESGHLSLVKYFVELQREGMHSLNYENETPLHLAARNGREYLVKYFAENGCNINAPSANGATCLHVACENGHYTTVECLLEHGAEVNAVNCADQTPLHIAANRGQTEIVELLYQHNANFSLRDKDGITAVLAASINGQKDTVRFIVQHGGNIKDTDGKGKGIAHFAVENENYDILNFLWQQNVSLDVQNYDGDTPLILAVREGRSRVVRYLAGKQCDINAQGKDGMKPLDVSVLKDNIEITRLLLELNARSCKSGMHIVAAARLGFMDLLQRFVDMGDDINVKVDNGESPLHAACEYGQVATVQYLCEHGALLDWQDNRGNTALHVAVNNGHLEATRVLVEKGANLCDADASDSTALHIAVKGGYLNIVKYLADSFAPIDRLNAKNETALLLAVVEGHEKIVSMLIEQGAGIVVRDMEGKTALDIATDKGYTAITQLLKDRAEGRKLVSFISHTGINTVSESSNIEWLKGKMNAGATADSATDRNDTKSARMFKTTAEDTLDFQSNPRSVLHTAAVNDNLEEVQRLVEAGIALDCGDPFGRTALWVAAKSGHKLIIRYLLQKGSCVNIPDCDGVKPTDIAVREGHWGAVNEFLKHDPEMRPEGTEILTNQLYEALDSGDLEVVGIILKCGISVNTNSKNGNTPLHVAVKSGHKEVTGLLLKCGANVNTANSDGKTPLILAAENGLVEIIQELLSATAVTDISTPLLSAATGGHIKVVRELLKRGASVDITDKDSLTPLSEAGENRHVEVVQELLNHDANVSTENKDGLNPLDAEGWKGHFEVLGELLKNGSNVNTANKESLNPLEAAGWKVHVKVERELLINGANMKNADKKGSTPLYEAGENGHVEVVRELLKHGANVNTANKDGFTPLHVAGRNGHFGVVRELLNNGANVNILSKEGFAPLVAASWNGHFDVVLEFLKIGANVNTAHKDGFTSLYVASRNGHVEVVRELLNHGANVNTENKYGFTPLYIASLKGHVEVVRELLKHGANVNSADEDGCTPLYAAGENGHVEVVRELLNHGTNVSTANKNGFTTLNAAAWKGHVEVVGELLKHGANVNNADNDGCIPLYAAGENGQVEVVRELLNHGADMDTPNKDDFTPLYVAGWNGHVEVVRELLKRGANLNTADKDGVSPLYAASRNGHVEVVRELLNNGANVNTVNKDGFTCLVAAGWNGHVEVVRELLDNGANVSTANKNGFTPLYVAGIKGHVGVVRELLKHGANVNAANVHGFTTLYIGCLKGHVEVVRELLKHGVNMNAADEDGCTPLYAAGENGHVEVVRELLNNGANVNTEDKGGCTPLYIACRRGHVEVVQELLYYGCNVDTANKASFTPLHIAGQKGHVEVVRKLLYHCANVDSVNNDGFTPLYVACLKGHVEVVRELLNHDANMNTADKDGCTPLYIAGANGHVEVLRELLNHGANLNTANEGGFNPLHIAVFKRHIEVVRELLKNGANVNVANIKGFTPLYIASLKGHVEVVRELLEHGANVNNADEDDGNPLYAAVENGHVEVLRELLNYGVNVNTENKYGFTPLYIAGLKGHVEVVRELLKNGANVNIIGKVGCTPLYAAGENGHVDVLRELLNHGANVNTASKEGFTPLVMACWKGHVEVVRDLLNHGANVNTADNDCFTPLYVEDQEEHIDVLPEWLFHGANVNNANKGAFTPLHIAVLKGHAHVVPELLNHGANVNTANEDGFTPLYLAALYGRVELLLELLNHGANMNTAGKDGSTPLYAASLNGHVDVVRELLNHDANMNTAGKDGSTPLYAASQNGHVEVVRELLNNGVNVNTENKYGFTPLYISRLKGHFEVVQELLNHGAQVEKSTKDGQNFIRPADLKAFLDLISDLPK